MFSTEEIVSYKGADLQCTTLFIFRFFANTPLELYFKVYLKIIEFSSFLTFVQTTYAFRPANQVDTVKPKKYKKQNITI